MTTMTDDDADRGKSEMERACAAKGVRIKCTYIGEKVDPDAEHASAKTALQWWKVTLTYKGRRLTTPFFQGMAHNDEPTAADVLACLCSDASAGDQSFEEFCSDLGYDVDSRKAEKTWRACKRMATRLPKFLGDDLEYFSTREH